MAIMEVTITVLLKGCKTGIFLCNCPFQKLEFLVLGVLGFWGLGVQILSLQELALDLLAFLMAHRFQVQLEI